MTEENPIIEEIRQTRERLLAQHKDDLDSLVTHLQQSAAAQSIDQVGFRCARRGKPARASADEKGRLKPAGRIYGQSLRLAISLFAGPGAAERITAFDAWIESQSRNHEMRSSLMTAEMLFTPASFFTARLHESL